MSACLLLGSNEEPRNEWLAKARVEIGVWCGQICRESEVYETAPWGFEADTSFLNQALLLETTLSPSDLLKKCLQIEKSLGRIRNNNQERYHSRNIDIDLLLYEDTICESQELTIPHPRLHLRPFALNPIDEILPYWVHPVFGFTAKEMIEFIEKCVTLQKR